MRPIAPRTGAPEVTVAEDQLEFQPLTVAMYDYQDGRCLLMRWRLDEAERERVAAGEDLYLMIKGKGIPPVKLQVGAEGFVI